MTSFVLLQLADSAFPTGGFAHSGGLEAAAALGEIASEDTLAAYLAQAIDSVASEKLPFVTAAHRDPQDLAAIDAACHAATPGEVASRASRAQGKAWLAAASAGLAAPGLRELKAGALRDGIEAHLAPVFGAVSRLAGLELAEAQRLFLFLHLRGLVSSAVRLGLVGPLAAQALQGRLAPALEVAWARDRDLGVAAVAATTPLHDLHQGHHDRLYSRMFSS